MVSNTATATYTFTASGSGCFTIVTKTITIIPNTTPLFNVIPAICRGATAPVLPATSNNGITGSWNPSTVSNLNSATYTFTPTTGQCAVTAILSVTVNTLITPVFTPIAPFCSGTLSPVLPTTSTNGITGTWSPATISNTASGTYTFTASTGQCANSVPLLVIILPKPIINIGVDRSICENTTTVLNATSINPLATYLWQNGSTNPTFSVSQAGTYSVTVNNGLCSATKAVVITIDSLPKFTLRGKNAICPGESFTLSVLSAQTNNNYLWQNGSTNTGITINTQGIYFVDATNNCGTIRKSFVVKNGICKLYMPNAFTPNGDGNNDTFKPGGGNTVNNFTMTIFNRWGQKVFTTNDVNKGWDGIFENKNQAIGNYIYQVTYRENNTGREVNLSGSFLLIR